MKFNKIFVILLKRIFAVCVVCLVTIIAFSAYFLFTKSDFNASKTIFIKHNFSLSDISESLYEVGIVKNKFFAELVLNICEKSGCQFKIGEYQPCYRASFYQVIQILINGDYVVRKITIPEGFSVAQVIERIGNNQFLTGTLDCTIPEGSIMPDTYKFTYPMSKNQIVSIMQKTMKNFLKKEFNQKSKDCKFSQAEQVLILASIVEKETGDDLERPIIAGVFFNRLSKKMRLQSCPTVIYALMHGQKLGRKLLYRDLKIDDHYNTYRYGGLPPTPICNPGRKSILAVLHPTKSDYLFFVLQKDKKHAFAENFLEHKKIKIRSKISSIN